MARTTVTTDMLTAEAVTTAKIDDEAVTTAKIDDEAVTTAKIDDDAVTTAKILDANVTAAKIDATPGTATLSKAFVFGITKNIDTFRMTGKLYTPQAAPETATDTATLTSAQMLSGILVCTPTTTAAYTTLLGADLETALLVIHPQLTAGDCFDLTLINIGGAGDDITLNPATGITVVGDAVVRSTADSGTEQAGQGTFRFRYTAADTFVAYRVS